MGFGYAITTTVVHDQGLWTPTGAFGRWAREVTGELGSAGFFEAPVNRRTNKTAGEPPVGSLRASVKAEMQQVTLRKFDITLGAYTHYAAYVVKGTGTIIARGEGGRFAGAEEGQGGMYLPSNLGFKSRWRQRVRGQQANPFLQRAWNDVSRHHSALPRFSTVTF